ncbi:branched-chain amino acid ABC transporter permease [Halobacteriaceae archaeon GCM10025711]
MIAIYALFVIIGTLLGYDLNGQVNTLRRITFLTAVYAMAVLALNLHWGYTGLFNIGVSGFMAVGVYTMAMVTAAPGGRVPGLGWPLWAGIVLGMAAAAFVGLLAALPALRLRADYLAIVTIAISEIIRYSYLSTAFQNFTLAGVELGTGGGSGIGIAKAPNVVLVDAVLENPVGEAILTPLFEFTQQLGVVPNVMRGWVYAAILLASVGAFYWLLMRIGFSPFGRVLKAIREDEDVASALGKNTRRFKIKSFMVGCALMGLAGILWMGSRGFINPNSFLPQVTFFVWIALIIGGAGSNTGGVLGGALFASILFEGPRFLARILNQNFDLGSAPSTFAGAVGPLFGDPMTVVLGPVAFPFFNVVPLASFSLANIEPLRLILMGVVLIYLMQNRPEGLLGHRKETAASIDLARPEPRGTAAATDGGEDE